MTEQAIMIRKPRPPFGQWILDQHHSTDQLGELARAAKRDPGFPRDGDFKAVSQRLNEVQADGDMHLVLEDAEMDWAAY